MKVNGKDDIPYMKWKIIQMFETTNQIWRFPKMGVHNSWMVYFMENSDLTWMIGWGTPILGNFHLRNLKLEQVGNMLKT